MVDALLADPEALAVRGHLQLVLEKLVVPIQLVVQGYQPSLVLNAYHAQFILKKKNEIQGYILCFSLI